MMSPRLSPSSRLPRSCRCRAGSRTVRLAISPAPLVSSCVIQIVVASAGFPASGISVTCPLDVTTLVVDP